MIAVMPSAFTCRRKLNMLDVHRRNERERRLIPQFFEKISQRAKDDNKLIFFKSKQFETTGHIIAE
jgi:hypothetical protein